MGHVHLMGLSMSINLLRGSRRSRLLASEQVIIDYPDSRLAVSTRSDFHLLSLGHAPLDARLLSIRVVGRSTRPSLLPSLQYSDKKDAQPGKNISAASCKTATTIFESSTLA